MNHILTYDEAMNEGVIDKIKQWIWPDIFRVTYDVTYSRKEIEKKEEKEHIKHKSRDRNKYTGKYKSLIRHVDIKAKNEDDAEAKFDEMVDKEMHDKEYKPEVEIIDIKKTKKIEHKSVKI